MLEITQRIGDDPLDTRFGGDGLAAEFDRDTDAIEYWKAQARPDAPPRPRGWAYQQAVLRATVLRALREGMTEDDVYGSVADAIAEHTPTCLEVAA